MGGLSEWPSPIKYGVWIKIARFEDSDQPFAERKQLAESLRSALQAAGVEIAGVDSDTGYMLEIYVGPKAPPKVSNPSN
jgi:hypothetical protein